MDLAIENFESGMQRGLSSYKRLLLWQRTLAQFPAPMSDDLPPAVTPAPRDLTPSILACEGTHHIHLAQTDRHTYTSFLQKGLVSDKLLEKVNAREAKVP